MSRLLDTVLLTALPASGKSEVRRYLALQDARTVAEDFHMGPTVQLDDSPYVHMMRRISQEMTAAKTSGLRGLSPRRADGNFLRARATGQKLSRPLNSPSVTRHLCR